MMKKLLMILTISFMFGVMLASGINIIAAPPAPIVGNDPPETFEGISEDNYIPQVDVDVYGSNPFDVAIVKYLQNEDNPPISYTLNHIPEGLFRIGSSFVFYSFGDVISEDEQSYSDKYTIKVDENLEGSFRYSTSIFDEYEYSFILGDLYYKWIPGSSYHEAYDIYDEFVEVIFVLVYPDSTQEEVVETNSSGEMSFQDYNDKTDDYFFISYAHVQAWAILHPGTECHKEWLYDGFRIYWTYGNDLIAIFELRVTTTHEDIVTWGLQTFGGGGVPFWLEE